MSMYKATSNASVIRLSDGACIPADRGNRDYRQYLADVQRGAEVLPAESLPALVPARDLAAEIDALKTRLKVVEKR